MENNKKIYAIVDWYDEKKGFGIARFNEIPLLLHSSYLNNKETKIQSRDIVSCDPVPRNGIYHALGIEVIDKLDKKNEEIVNRYMKK